MRKLLISLQFLIGIPAVAGPVTDVTNAAYWMCKHHAEVRTIRVVAEKNSCTTFYIKRGAEKSVGSGMFSESCLNFLNNIKTNLIKSGWDCKDITSSHMTIGG